MTGHRRPRRSRPPACAPTAGDIECEVVVNAGGMYAAEIGRHGRRARAGRADGPRVPRDAAVPRAFGEPPAHAARPRPPHLLPRGGRRAGDGRLRARLRAVGGGRRAGRDPGGLQRPPAGGGLGPLRARSSATRARVPAMADVARHAADQRARGVHPRRRVLPGRDRGARAVRGRRLLRPRAGRRRRRRPGRWPSGSPRASPRWTCGSMDVRRFGAQYRSPRVHAARACARSTRPTTTSSTRTTSARPGGRCGCRRPTTGTVRTARRSARSRAGSG